MCMADIQKIKPLPMFCDQMSGSHYIYLLIDMQHAIYIILCFSPQPLVYDHCSTILSVG